MLSRRNIFEYIGLLTFISAFGIAFNKDENKIKFYLNKIIVSLTKTNNLSYNFTNLNLNNNHVKIMHLSIYHSMKSLKKKRSIINSETLLKDMIAKDYINKNTLNIDGWILSEIEVIIMTFIEKYNSVYRL
jgi:hypothetical protein